MKRNNKGVLLLFFIIVATSCFASQSTMADNGQIQIRQATVQGSPKTSSIQASINGHTLSVVFLENLGQVSVEVTTASGGVVDAFASPTPNGMNICITNTGSYVVTFTLSNGDVYYGEFEVTD